MHITEQEYFTAIDRALDIINAKPPDAPYPWVVEGLAAVVAWAYDRNLSTSDTLDVMRMEPPMRDIGLRIIVGSVDRDRLETYPRRVEIELLHAACRRDKARRDEPPDDSSAGVPIRTPLWSAIQTVEQAYERGGPVLAGEEIDSLAALVEAVRHSALHAVVGPRELVSGLLIRIALNLAQKKVRVSFASARMPSPAVVLRMLAADAGVRAVEMRNGDLDNPDWIHITQSTSRLAPAPLSVLSRATLPRLHAALSSEADIVVVDDLLAVLTDRAPEIEELSVATTARSSMLVGVVTPTLEGVGMPTTAFELVVTLSHNPSGWCTATIERSGMPAGTLQLHYDVERDLISTTFPRMESR